MTHSTARLFIGTGSLLVLGAVALLYRMAVTVRSGVLDVRPKHTPPSKSEWLLAAQEPFWFYGTIALLTAFAVFVLFVGLWMIRDARKR